MLLNSDRNEEKLELAVNNVFSGLKRNLIVETYFPFISFFKGKVIELLKQTYLRSIYHNFTKKTY